MAVNRRALLKSVVATGAAVAAGTAPAVARTRRTAPPDALGMLYDTTRCIGCKTCVVACAQFRRASVHGPRWHDVLRRCLLGRSNPLHRHRRFRGTLTPTCVNPHHAGQDQRGDRGMSPVSH